MSRFLSGIQPSGFLHLGNYFGAIQQHLVAPEHHECFFFIADFHSVTTVRDATSLREWTRDVAATYLAMGLDTKKAVFWRQSDVPEVLEVAWLLSCVTGTGLLERAHSFKDKVTRGLHANVGLFYYPVLMAADILSFEGEVVPVGQDQVQHVEMAQDMAGSFNAAFGEVFKKPTWKLSKTPKVMGVDGQKMSKSYGNYVGLFEEGKTLKKSINRIPTDSAAPEDPKEPEGMLIFDWLKLFVTDAEFADWCARAREGGKNGPGYGHVKQRIVEAIDQTFGPAREERRRLLSDPTKIDDVLLAGAERARAVAEAVRDRAYRACGLR